MLLLPLPTKVTGVLSEGHLGSGIRRLAPSKAKDLSFKKAVSRFWWGGLVGWRVSGATKRLQSDHGSGHMPSCGSIPHWAPIGSNRSMFLSL